ncbi:FMN-binding protein [uncultured Parasutterella sp.]
MPSSRTRLLIDNVSGASVTSNGFRTALADALSK